ncbi:hypothetical protein Y032_0227g2838 [Ancylostoma ceylanicum]|uniref:Uncharacterized protein n=1 Tax=Ancylostoma ceylanicum TaxID=53326 RepID=A0A016SHU4_9BILA|nr:hypothetical protein Y032_0227g2838 [Ancylostoma ceylanicum]
MNQRTDPYSKGNEDDEVTTTVTVESLCRRAQQVCTHTRHNLRHGNSAYASKGCPKRNDNIYATTFGTRCRSCSDDKGITVVNIYPRAQSADGGMPRSYHRAYGKGKEPCRMASGGDHRREGRPSLPYWHIAEAAARIKEEETQYNRKRAAEAWDQYFLNAGSELDDEVRKGEAQLKAVSGCPEHGPGSGRDRRVQRATFRCGRNETDEVLPKTSATRFKAETGKLGGFGYEKTHEAMVAPFQRDGAYVKCDGNAENCAKLCAEGALAQCRCHKGEPEKVKSHKRRNRSAPAQICRCRPFYGTTELEKNSLNAINHLLKAEKELRKVHFTAGSVMPKAQEYVHAATKLFIPHIAAFAL